jgi:hypothetical protein
MNPWKLSNKFVTLTGASIPVSFPPNWHILHSDSEDEGINNRGRHLL